MSERDAALETAILSLLIARGPGKTICPSEAARAVSPANWYPLMEPARAAAHRLVAAGRVLITQHGRPVTDTSTRGPIRLRLRK